MKKWLLVMLMMTFMADGDLLTRDALDPGRTNIKGRAGEIKGWLKKDTLDPYRINIYDKYGNQKGFLKRDTLSLDTWRFRENK